ncbi:hypothetical protein GCM10022384_32970 [Streptomyces marokkonensis]|uniref:Uncharacterized protein n=1 Tax=Streptomyces marokkonensis TaxID=324855 RepID=A0ABP7QFD0_9ACTN
MLSCLVSPAFDSTAFLPFLGAVTAAPALAVVTAGHLLDNPSLLWAGVPVSVTAGFVAYMMLGRAGSETLIKRGPELLYLMRTGKAQQDKGGGPGASFIKAMPKHRQQLL